MVNSYLANMTPILSRRSVFHMEHSSVFETLSISNQRTSRNTQVSQKSYALSNITDKVFVPSECKDFQILVPLGVVFNLRRTLLFKYTNVSCKVLASSAHSTAYISVSQTLGSRGTLHRRLVGRLIHKSLCK